MEEILKKANELGLLLKKTEAFRHFEEASARVEEDDQAGALLKRYNEIAESIQARQERGYEIENFEKENFREIMDMMKENPLLLDYLRAREAYMELLMSIHNALGSGNVI